ncbi:pentapeptide repeat-containing protein [Streptomyces odontomachi]|uniref:pentapeptide repeat-containing protein n=1 Tax=Streptomyces odontomachi TaxID=2944940 RepID=UPI00210D7BC3|nr:pentapeptide repeat-containing protein [Streptomyces sp. ODS25]
MQGQTVCLAHMDVADREIYLSSLSPDSPLDHRGTPFNEDLLAQLLNALRDPTGKPNLGRSRFDWATFSGDADFDQATFSDEARFGDSTFSGDALFSNATFSGTAYFRGATFSHDAQFGQAIFSSDAHFGQVTFSRAAHFYGANFSNTAHFYGATFSSAAFSQAIFSGDALFSNTSFSRNAHFYRATFYLGAMFDCVVFSGNVLFRETQFKQASQIGPLICGKWVALDRAMFQYPVTLEISARQVSFVRTRLASTAKLQLRYAELNLQDAVFEYPVLITGRPTPFHNPGPEDPLPERELSDLDPGVRLTSVSGVDAAYLALHDIDLSDCRFTGAVHLDQLRIDGWCTFATTPTGWFRHAPWHWSQRNTLAEEHHWRARIARRPTPSNGWTLPSPDTPELRPAAVAALYRQLRKSLEDGKNEPDAADFYYGEMEMRRHDATRPRSERALLTAYWAVSGYGLRATRALAWLGVAMTATIAAMTLWGIPANEPKPHTTGRQVTAGQMITLTTDTPAPVNPVGPWTERVTTMRFERSLRVVINSVVFRSSNQDLTTTGTYTEMASRLAEPVLLGLALLAVRNRVKR